MAVLARDPSGAEYTFVEQGLQDRILSIYGNADREDDYFRPDLADKHKVGFFSLDRCSQTDLTEIVDLKEMTEVLQVLLQDVATLRRDINFTKHVMQADYESKLQEKSLELYCRINERVTELEKLHEERVGTVRRAFRQQLSDAIARVSVLYNKNLQRRIRTEKDKHQGDAGQLEQKYKEMQMTIRQNESVIHMLKMQIQQLQKEPSIADSPSVSDRPSAITPQTPSIDESTRLESAPSQPSLIRPVGVQVIIKPMTKSKHTQTEESVSSKTPSINQEVEILKEELEAAQKKMELIQESLQSKDDENIKLGNQVESLNEELMLEQEKVQQLKIENAQIRAAVEQDKASSQQMLQKQRQEMEKMMEEKMKLAREQSSKAAEAELRAKEKAEKDKLKFMTDQKKLLEEQLARRLEEERQKNAELNRGDTDVDKLRRNEQMLKEEINRLKREVDRIHRTWEKKFAILQQSLHALKDESYLRQTLQRQAAALHHASISYSADTPIGIIPSSKHTSPTKRPLPDIPKFGNKSMQSNPTPGGGHPEKDYISYTVSAPSGRGTAMFSVDENQVMSENDKEDFPTDIVPLPDKPVRKSQPSVEEERPPSQERGRVVTLHVAAQ